MRWMHRALRDARDERGSVLVLTALTLTALVGMTSLTLDAGRYFVERRQLQNAVDGSALAAARYLPATDGAHLAAAQDAALAVASDNGVPSGDVSVSITSTDVAADTVTVAAARDVDFAFARVLGIATGTVHATATVQLGSLAGIAGVMPLGVEQPVGGLAFGDSYCLKLTSGGHDQGSCTGAEQGNFHALDIDNDGSDSASNFRDRLTDGSLTTVRVGEHINVASGNMSGPTEQGLGCDGAGGRLGGNTQTFDDVVEEDATGARVLDWSSPRLVILPLVTYPGSDEAVVQGFGLFFIDACGSGAAVTGRYIETVVRGGEWGAYRPDDGTHAIRITQ